ncbi:Type I restriction-modification system, specificity subunit S [gamma proteobacterium IMCC1989]|nr:Type I restriction-modification system, specificity subunit S [gamma proteobacterium IMCC1989]
MSASTNINNKNPDALITDHIDVWASAIKRKSTQGRGSSKKVELYGVKKLRELILELAVRGLLVPQDPNDEPASVLLEKIAAEKEQLIKEGKIKKQKPLPPISDEEKPFKLLNNGWVWTQLGEIAEIAPRNALDDDMEVGFVPMPRITTSYDGSHEQEVRPWGTIKKGYTHFSNGDIALAKITPCFENSKAAVFRGLKNGYGAGTTELHIARPIQDTVNPLYILLYLKAPMFLEKGKSKMTGSAGQKRIPNSYFSGNPLPLPPLKEQHRIVTKVNELMTLCDQLEQQQETSITAHQTLVETLLSALTNSADNKCFEQAWTRIAENFDTLFTTEHSIDQLKKSILQLAVMGKLVPQDSSNEPAEILLQNIAKEKEYLIENKKIRKAKLRGATIEYELPFEVSGNSIWTTIDKISLRVIDGNYGESYPTKNEFLDEGVPFLTSAAIGLSGNIRHDKVKYISKEKHAELRKAQSSTNDILLTNRGARAGAVGLLEDAIYKDCNIGPQLTSIRCLDQYVDPNYLLIYMQTNVFIKFLNEANSGSAMNFVNLAKTVALPVVLHPLKEQKRIVSKVGDLFSLCDLLKEQIKNSQISQLHLADAITEQAIAN